MNGVAPPGGVPAETGAAAETAAAEGGAPSGGVRIKICGLRTVAAAVAARDAGADLLGFNFAPVSRRRVDLAHARAAIAAVRAGGGPAPAAVGIFVNQPVDEVAAAGEAAGLDYLQLSGDEDADYCAALARRSGRPIIKAIRLTGDAGAPADAYAGVALLLADAAGTWGGSGQSWDWSAAAGLAARRALLLAGGLTPDNVGRAIAAVRPWGVDVASGVERDGQTDPALMRAFITAAKASAGANASARASAPAKERHDGSGSGGDRV